MVLLYFKPGLPFPNFQMGFARLKMGYRVSSEAELCHIKNSQKSVFGENSITLKTIPLLKVVHFPLFSVLTTR
jgi:hypothetical protein